MSNILEESFDMYIQYLHNILGACQNLSEYIRTEQFNHANQLLLQFPEGIHWMFTMNNLLYENKLIPKLNSEVINEHFLGINNAMMNEDLILVADLFEYELLPIFSEHLEAIKVQ